MPRFHLAYRDGRNRQKKGSEPPWYLHILQTINEVMPTSELVGIILFLLGVLDALWTSQTSPTQLAHMLTSLGLAPVAYATCSLLGRWLREVE